MNDSAITVYSKSACTQCEATKRALRRAGVSFQEVDLTQDADALAYVQMLGYAQAPVVVAGDDHWSGYRPDRIADLPRPAA